MDQRDPYDAIVYHTPKPSIAPEILQRQEHEAIFRGQAPAPRASALTRPQVARDEVCILDGRGGHYRLAVNCPHGVMSVDEHVWTDGDAEWAAMHPNPPAVGKDWTVHGTDFGRGTR
jgi:hypothetical protein